MQTQLEVRPRPQPPASTGLRLPPERGPAPERAPAPGRHRFVIGEVVISVVLIAATIAATITIAVSGRSEPSAEPLVVSVGDGAAASCLVFDVNTLAAMPTAFAATVTGIDADAVSMTVDHWYTPGDADLVRLETVENAQALIGGFPIEVGTMYLITATDGAMNYCGYSGAATPELEALFAQAFAG